MPFDPPAGPPPLITASQIASVIDERDPILRNLQITQSYHDLSIAVGRHLGQRDGAWCLFATWASKTAGGFIRGEWLPKRLRRMLASDRIPRLRAVRSIDERVRHHVARGNRSVYAEIGPLFATVLELLETPAPHRAARLAQATASLRPGPVEDGGEDALALALRVMVEAADLPPGPPRAQRILLANLLVGAHEQYRLQATIEGALDAVWDSAVSPRAHGLEARLAPWLRQRMTRWMMQLGLPETSMPLGRDVPALPDGAMFPADLEHVTLPELHDLLERFDRTPNTTQGSAASDWSDYGDRMNFLVDMFRSRQQSPGLWTLPFGHHGAHAIRSGRIPAGPL